MNRILISLALVLSAATAAAQVVVESDLNAGTAWGKSKLIKEAPREITISQFNLNFMLSRVAGAGKSYNRIAMRAELDLDKALAQRISDEAFAYLKAQLEAKGYTVKVHDLAVLGATRTFAKFAKKNDDAATSGGGVVEVRNADKVDERFAAYALGVPGANLGRDPGPGYSGYTELAMELGGKEGKLTLSVTGTYDFTRASSSTQSVFGITTNEVGFEPSLQLIDVSANGGHPALAWHSSSAIGGKFWGGFQLRDDGHSWLKGATRVNDGLVRYSVDEALFAEAALTLARDYLDRLVARVDAVKLSGK